MHPGHGREEGGLRPPRRPSPTCVRSAAVGSRLRGAGNRLCQRATSGLAGSGAGRGTVSQYLAGGSRRRPRRPAPRAPGSTRPAASLWDAVSAASAFVGLGPPPPPPPSASADPTSHSRPSCPPLPALPALRARARPPAPGPATPEPPRAEPRAAARHPHPAPSAPTPRRPPRRARAAGAEAGAGGLRARRRPPHRTSAADVDLTAAQGRVPTQDAQPTARAPPPPPAGAPSIGSRAVGSSLVPRCRGNVHPLFLYRNAASALS